MPISRPLSVSLGISLSHIAPRLGTRLRTEFVTGMGKVDEQFLILLNIDRVFSSEELAVAQDAGQVEVGEVAEIQSDS